MHTTRIVLLQTVQHLALHSVLNVAAADHRVDNLEHCTLRILLTREVLCMFLNLWLIT